ncbi:DUF2254 domain-containing protein [Actinoplanes sp. NPDC049316]|uniref:DUF2254 domain-containing protein n=1 Tax=Actinoplanes sp. NPDC049316 TaxID=3154727 RepID=UPI0034357761
MARAGARRRAVQDAWRSRLWPLPMAGVVGAVLLGVGLPELDDRLVHRLPEVLTHFLFRGGPDAGRGVLAAVAGSLITVTSLTFSLTVVTLQLASSQHSPRVLRTFSQDRVVHVTLAALLGTFVYALTVMRTVRTDFDGQEPFVPQLSVTVAYLFTLASVIALVVFLAHLARKIRVESMLRDVHAETNRTLRRELVAADAPSAIVEADPADAAVTVCAGSSGFLIAVDEEALFAAVVEADAVVRLHRRPGDSLVAGTPIAVAWPAGDRPLDDAVVERLRARVQRGVQTGFERTATQDVAYGLRQIVDIALRALSPGVNDPTTAVHAIGHAAALLCCAADRPSGPRVLRDEAGRPRVLLDRPDLSSLLRLAVAQPSRYGAQEPEVTARLLMLLREVAWSSRDPRHHRAVLDHLALVLHHLGGQDLPPGEAERLEGLARLVHDAVDHRWPVPSGVPCR